MSAQGKGRKARRPGWRPQPPGRLKACDKAVADTHTLPRPRAQGVALG
jgi:hypothetical protein